MPRTFSLQHLLLATICATLAVRADGAPLVYSATHLGYYQKNVEGSSVQHFTGAIGVVSRDGAFPTYISNGYGVFDLGSLSAPISSGNLRVRLLTDSFSWSIAGNSATETFSVYDVGTNINTLINTPTSSPLPLFPTVGAIHTDLESGALYATGSATSSQYNQFISIPLSAQAIKDINSARGTVMAMGFKPTSRPYESLGFNAAQLSLNPFGAPVDGGGAIDFRLDEPTIIGGGTVDLNPLGVVHHLNASALGLQSTDTDMSEVRRRFIFAAASQPPNGVPIFLRGDVDGRLFANEGSASVRATMQLYNATGTLIDSEELVEEIAAGILETRSADLDRSLVIAANLVPGEIYEIVSRLTLNASISTPTGRADALFGNSFAVNLSGVVPEPGSGLVLTAAAMLLIPLRASSETRRAGRPLSCS